MAQRGLDEGAERQHGSFDDRPLVQAEAVFAGQPQLELLPDPVVRPGPRVIGRVALEVQPLDVGRALADQGEPVRRLGVDQLRRACRRLDEDPEPRVRVLAEVLVTVLDEPPGRPAVLVAVAEDPV